jgi:hypothetical protein
MCAGARRSLIASGARGFEENPLANRLTRFAQKTGFGERR